MSLVFNLVTQQDAANNIGIAKAMKRDSSSMNGIALLTMAFLPGTFTSVSRSSPLSHRLNKTRYICSYSREASKPPNALEPEFNHTFF